MVAARACTRNRKVNSGRSTLWEWLVLGLPIRSSRSLTDVLVIALSTGVCHGCRFGGGFEIETELTIKAIVRGYRIAEVPIDLVQFGLPAVIPRFAVARRTDHQYHARAVSRLQATDLFGGVGVAFPGGGHDPG